MTGSAGTVELEVAAGELQVGDVVCLPHGLRRRVVELQRYVEDTGQAAGPRVRVIVELGRETSWESRAGAAKGSGVTVTVTLALRPYRPSELVTVERPLEGL